MKKEYNKKCIFEIDIKWIDIINNYVINKRIERWNNRDIKNKKK